MISVDSEACELGRTSVTSKAERIGTVTMCELKQDSFQNPHISILGPAEVGQCVPDDLARLPRLHPCWQRGRIPFAAVAHQSDA